MAKLESLDKLREELGRRGESTGAMGLYLVDYEAAMQIAAQVEHEIDSRYMLLPVDADGVPIHVGDYLQLGETRGEAVALTYCPSNGKLPWEWQCDTGDWYNTAFAHHVKPRTLESILCDALADVSCMGDGIVRHFEPDEPYVVELADEIRELLGGDAE